MASEPATRQELGLEIGSRSEGDRVLQNQISEMVWRGRVPWSSSSPLGIPGNGLVQGPQGLQGLKGDDGEQGAAGPQGPQGVQGPQGLQGNDGADGVGVSIAGEVSDPTELPDPGTIGEGYLIEGILWLWDDGQTAWYSTGATLRGPQGIQGIQGVQGPEGPQGIQGVQGLQGVQGPPMAFEDIYSTHNIIGTANAQITINLKRAPKAPFVMVSLGMVAIAQAPGKYVHVNSIPIAVGAYAVYPIVSVLGSPNYSANEYYLYVAWSSDNTRLEPLYISASNAAPTPIYGSLSPQIWDMG